MTRAAKELTATALSTPVRSGDAHRDGRDGPRRRRRRRASFDARRDRDPRRRGARAARDADAAGARRCSERSATRPTTRCCTPTRSLLPRARRARASWNYLLDRCDGGADGVQGQLPHEPAAGHRRRARLPRHPQRRRRRIAPDAVLAAMHYTHPVYTPRSVAAQARLAVARRRPDRVRRRVPRVGLPRGRLPLGRAGRRALRVRRGEPPVAPGAAPARGRSTRGSRTAAVSRCATASPTGTRSGWSTSTTCPRCAARSARCSAFDARDHLGDPGASIRANLDAFLARAGRARPRRVLLLTNPRSLGHAFNPLSVFWCLDRGGLAACGRRRGAQHLRRAALLPAASRRARAAPTPRRRSTSRRSSPSTGGTRCSSPTHGERPRRRRSRCYRDDRRGVPRVAARRSRRRPCARSPLAALRHPATAWWVMRSHPPAGHPALAARPPDRPPAAAVARARDAVPRARRSALMALVEDRQDHGYRDGPWRALPRAAARPGARRDLPARCSSGSRTASTCGSRSPTAGRSARRTRPTPRCASTATTSSTASGATGSSASASRTWRATGTPTTSAPRCARSRRVSSRWCRRGCSACATSTCATSRPRRRTRCAARAATSRVTTTCRTTCSRCSSTRR